MPPAVVLTRHVRGLCRGKAGVMAEPLEVTEARVDAVTMEWADAQNAWEARVRAGDDDPANLLTVAAAIVDMQGKLRELREDIARATEYERVREGRKRRKAMAELLNTRFTDKQVLAALKRALGKSSVGATGARTIAHSLAGHAPTQSDRIRAGLALSRLAMQGKVIKLVAGDDRTAHVWSLPGVTIADWIYRTHREEAAD
jgi:hypothetical protein